MDKRIFITFFAIIILASFILFIRWYGSTDCDGMEIKASAVNAYAGQNITFTAHGNEKVNWNFGGNTTKNGNEVVHEFDSAGSYIVKAENENKCTDTIEITIAPKREMTTVIPDVKFPEGQIYAGDEVTFTDRTKEAKEWNWIIERTKKTSEKIAASKSRIFTTNFIQPGNYTLIVSVKGDFVSGADTFRVNVRQKYIQPPKRDGDDPPPPPPPPPAFCSIKQQMSDEEFKIEFVGACNAIAKVDDEEANAVGSDKMLELAKEMCEGYKTPIKLAGEDRSLSLNSFIKSLQSGEYTKVVSINFPPPHKGYITSINVSAIRK